MSDYDMPPTREELAQELEGRKAALESRIAKLDARIKSLSEGEKHA